MTDPQPRKPWKIGFRIGAVVVFIFTVYGFLVPYFAKSWEKSNQFGGMFGGIGALFSGLALAGVVAALWLQKHSLEDQREDLKATPEELRRSAQAQQDTTTVLHRQVEALLLAARITAEVAIMQYYTTPHVAGMARAEQHRVRLEGLVARLDQAEAQRTPIRTC